MRRPALGPGSSSLSNDSAAPTVVGGAAVVLSWQHAHLAAALQLDRPQPLSLEWWRSVRRRRLCAASLVPCLPSGVAIAAKVARIIAIRLGRIQFGSCKLAR